MVGTGMLAENSWKGKHSLSRIAVEEGFRLRGAGSAMRERMEGEARKMGLKEIIAFCYEGVLGFWAKSGFYPNRRGDTPLQFEVRPDSPRFL